ncbi:MAG: hypothetical protein HFE67_03600, partial [Erysipelotrichaceae bacterium]|nr:hypothetical protein [Erysipelotrichaceae bacterium]
MWKRLLILAVTLLSVSSIVCGYYAFQMDAAGGYQSGGNLTGRVNKAPAGLSTSALAKGDKFILNIQGTTSQPLTWLLVYNSTSKTWMSASIESMGSTNAMDDLSNMALFYYRNSKMKAVVDILNNRLISYPLESRILVPRTINLSWGTGDYQKQDPNEVQFFLPTVAEFDALGISRTDPIFTFQGWMGTVYGTREKWWHTISSYDLMSNTNEIHPFVYWDLSDVVFSVSKGNSSTIGQITSSQNDSMKTRFENSSMSAQLNAIENKNNNQISKVLKDSTVYLNASANAGNDGNGGIYTISALVFNDSGQFVYYQPLAAANGTSRYAFDLSGIPTGRYKIAVVNEAYNESSITPADSSLISSPLSLEIVEPINISVSGNANLTTSVNVDQGDPVAMISCNGGVAPISYTLISDTSVSGHSADYQKFRLSGNQIVVDEANGLHAGDYYLQVSAVDANGDPVGGVASGTVHIVVNATTLSVAFNNVGVTKKSIAQATAGWSEIASTTPSQGT